MATWAPRMFPQQDSIHGKDPRQHGASPSTTPANHHYCLSSTVQDILHRTHIRESRILDCACVSRIFQLCVAQRSWGRALYGQVCYHSTMADASSMDTATGTGTSSTTCLGAPIETIRAIDSSEGTYTTPNPANRKTSTQEDGAS